MTGSAVLYRSVVFLHGSAAVVGGLAAAISPGWWLFDRHFQRLWDLDWRLHLQAKSLLLLMGAAWFAFGVVVLALLWVRERRARAAAAGALVLADALGFVEALIGLHNFSLNDYSVALVALFGFLLLSAVVLALSEGIAFTASTRERPA